MLTIKTYKRRDSATSVLRKMGVNSRDYGLFIKKLDDGQFECDVPLAESHLKKLSETTKPKKVKAKAKKEKRVTISSMCRDMILDGATNAQIFESLQKNFGEERFGPEKRHYPAWYRCELRRKGQLPPAFDPINQDPNAVHMMED